MPPLKGSAASYYQSLPPLKGEGDREAVEGLFRSLQKLREKPISQRLCRCQLPFQGSLGFALDGGMEFWFATHNSKPEGVFPPASLCV